MSGNSVSFFDDKLEDESIALSDSELNNIFNVDVAEEASIEDSSPQFDDAEMLRSEPDVIVVEKKDLSSLYSVQPAVPVIDNTVLPLDEFVEAAEVPVEAIFEEPSEPTELSFEPEIIEEISTMDTLQDEAPAMSALDGEETLPMSEELTLEELTAEQPSGIEELESLPDLIEAEELAGIPESIEQIFEEPQTVEEVSELAEEPQEMSELVESEPESVEEILSDGIITFDEPPVVETSITEVSIDETGIVEDLPSLDMSDNTFPEEIAAEEVITEETPIDPVSFEEVAPITFADSSEIGNTDQIVLDESLAAPQELIIEENVPEIVLDESSSEPMAAGEPQEVNFDEISLVEDEPATVDDRGEVTEEHTIFSGEESSKQRVENSNSFFGDTDEDEAITLSTDELSNILDNAEVEEKSGMPVETSSAFSSTPVVSSDNNEPVHADSSELFETLDSSLSRENLKEVFVYIDNLLDKLPEVEIQKFARSKYYDIYNRIFEELGII
jgi:hypothetical protein